MRALTSIGLLLCLLLSGCGQQDLSSPTTISLSAIPTEVEIGQRVVVNATLITTNALPTLDWRSTLHPSLRLIRQDTLPSQSEDDQIWTTQSQFVFTGFYETNAPVFAASRADRSSGIPPPIELPVQDLRFRAPDSVTNNVPMIGNEELPDFRTDAAIEKADSITGGLLALLLGMTALGLLAFAGWFLKKKFTKQTSDSAESLAHQELAFLQVVRLPIDRRARELSGILQRYLTLRYQLPSQCRTTEELLKYAGESAPWGTSRQTFIEEFLYTCDQVKFAGRDKELAEQLNKIHARLPEFIDSCAPSLQEVEK